MIAVLASLLLLLAIGPLVGDPVISEFLASNDGGLLDEDGAAADWIEIHNPARPPSTSRAGT